MINCDALLLSGRIFGVVYAKFALTIHLYQWPFTISRGGYSYSDEQSRFLGSWYSCGFVLKNSRIPFLMFMVDL